MGRNLFEYLAFTVHVLNTPIFRRKLHICTALQGLPRIYSIYLIETPHVTPFPCKVRICQISCVNFIAK